ncbi:diguanylate cyclase domain-containing protein [Solimonas sp. K1W22B-7]|uniref:TackOD1 domain-containing metal-binding protein n=1 Tax=Solimonas sp. K1W22B-7 TaxID=2303331 RepID=UPI0013C43D90|nr:diguanylate cyclase [Solimonas sp. K1W22B-7]
MTSNDIVIFAPRTPDSGRLLLAGRVAHCFSDYRGFRESGLKPAAFIVRSTDPAATGEWLRQIRRDPDHAARLAFVEGSVGEADAPVGDGPLPATVPELLERIDASVARAQAMRDKDDDRSPAALLLEYLWLRPGATLEPRADWRHPRLHHYPLLDVLERGDTDPQGWLQQLERDGLLTRGELRARQRECDFCGSAHLSFIDVCPSCRSIDIDQHAALHCFTCGLIAPEDRFTRGGGRCCPKCGTHLRHIGSDYDRPLETTSCRSCEHVFVEGEVVARCAVCDHSMAPTALRLHKLWSWRLSSRGCLVAQGRNPAQSPALFDAQHYASREHFSHSLDWLLKIGRSQGGTRLALLGLRLGNAVTLAEQLGAGRASQLVDAFAERLRELLIESDLATRLDAETLCLLLPGADRDRLAQLHEAVGQLQQRAVQPEGIGPSWQLAKVMATTADGTNAASLLEALEQQWQRPARARAA